MEGNTRVIQVYSTYSVPAVEICGKAVSGLWTPRRRPGANGRLEGLRACSACAGDYEDPDRTAWTPEERGEAEDEVTSDSTAEEFPAER